MQLLPPNPRFDPSTFTHAVVVLTVVIAATVLRGFGQMDTPTLSAVYLGAMGYATGLSVGRRGPGGGPGGA